jgi:anti-sigma B factor antagonist
MEINVKSIAQVTVVEIVGDIDSNTAPQAQEQVLPLAQQGTRILLDMSGVEYMSSAGLRMLLSMYRQISRQNGGIVLVGLNEEIKDTMAITGFLNFFITRDTVDEGLQALA